MHITRIHENICVIIMKIDFLAMLVNYLVWFEYMEFSIPINPSFSTDCYFADVFFAVISQVMSVPTDTWRNNKVIVGSKRRRDVVLTFSWRGYFAVCLLVRYKHISPWDQYHEYYIYTNNKWWHTYIKNAPTRMPQILNNTLIKWHLHKYCLQVSRKWRVTLITTAST